MSKTVSVVVPVYNAEKTVGKCIRSILAQTHTDLELILVDDGSPDKSGLICDEYAEKDERVQVIHTPNGGVSRARNTGIERARGEYLFFVDSDDWVEAEHIAKLLPVHDEDLVYGGIKFYVKGRFSEEKVIPARVVEQNEWISNFNEFGKGRFAIFFISPCYRMKIIHENNLRFDTNLGISEDGLFNLAYLKYCKKIRYEESSTYCYEDGDASSSSLSHSFHSNRLRASLQECMMIESITGKPEYDMRWYHWHIAFHHFRYWLKHGNAAVKQEARKRIKECYQNTFFRECIPSVRRTGSLDEKIETYFLRYVLFPLYRPVYSVVKLSHRVKQCLIP